MRVCQFRHFGVARRPNGAAKAYTANHFTGAEGARAITHSANQPAAQLTVRVTLVERVMLPEVAVTVMV
jgi:hypothetical protein